MQLAVALDGAPAPIGATTFDPYGQLVKMLLPRAQSIAIYDRMGLPVWLNDGLDSPDLGLDEIEFIKSETFINQAARTVGYGSEGETAFRLPADVPAAQPLPALGVGGAGQAPLTPLEAWMELLFEG